AGADQGVGLCRLRFRPRLGAHRAPLGGGWSRGVGLGGGHRCALGALVHLLAPSAGHARDRLTERTRGRPRTCYVYCMRGVRGALFVSLFSVAALAEAEKPRLAVLEFASKLANHEVEPGYFSEVVRGVALEEASSARVITRE